MPARPVGTGRTRNPEPRLAHEWPCGRARPAQRTRRRRVADRAGSGWHSWWRAPTLVCGVKKGAGPVSDAHGELPRLLTAAETAAPVEAVDVVSEDLRRRFNATKVSFLILDLTGK